MTGRPLHRSTPALVLLNCGTGADSDSEFRLIHLLVNPSRIWKGAAGMIRQDVQGDHCASK